MITEAVETSDNPFPGLRPFQYEESHLFFGREGLSEELLSRLSEARFLAVVGTSGSGKSSLVRAGLLPALCGGLMTEAGSDWRVAILRPCNGPISELARALNDPRVLGLTIDENEEAQRIIIESTLRRGSLGLVEIVCQAKLMEEDENLLIVVDQFEELFRYAGNSPTSRFLKCAPFSASESKPASEPGSSNNGQGLQPAPAEKYENEAAAFVKLLLEATRQHKVPIFVVITMRSEYLGDCAQFWGLPEAINEGQYLVPRLTREQQRLAITGPIKIYGAEITPRLINQLLNGMGDDSDQLPLLQHALMRTWKKGGIDSHGKKLLDLNHYIAIGGMAGALSKHAEGAYNYLSDEQKKIAEKLFKCLTVKVTEGREIRRPTALKDICEIIDEKEEDVIEVIEVFRRRGRCFLMPPVSEPLKSESQIDISHESLIRCWERLSSWVDEESKSASQYRRLADSALLHEEERAELLRGSDAHFAIEWDEENNPTEAWAKRYHDADFKIVMGFLQESKELREQELEAEETQRRKVIRQKFVRILKSTLSVASLLLLAVSIFAIWKRIEADKQSEAAEHRSFASQMAVAQINYNQGDYAAANEKLNRLRVYIESNLNQKFNDFAGFEWYYLWRLGHNEEATLRDPSKRPIYAVAFDPHDGRRFATGCDDGTVKLWDTNDKQVLRTLAVSQGFAVRAVAFSPTDRRVLATESADGSVRLWDLNEGQEMATLQPSDSRVIIASGLAFSPDGKMLAAVGTTLTDRGEQGLVSIWDVASGKRVIDPREVHRGETRSILAKSIAFSPVDGKTLAVGTEEGVELWSLSTGEDQTPQISKNSVILPEVPVFSVAFSPAHENILALGCGDSQVILWDTNKSEKINELKAHLREVSSVVFSSTGDRLAAGSYDGSVTLWDTSDSDSGLAQIYKQATVKQRDQFLALKPTFKGHSGYVNSIAFSPDGKTLVSGSNDGTAKLWSATKTWQDLAEPELKGSKIPIHGNATLSLAFYEKSPVSEGPNKTLRLTSLVSGSADKTLRLTSIGDLMSERSKLEGRDSQKVEDLVKKYSRSEPCPEEVSSVAISGKKKRILAAGNWDGSVLLWDLSRGENLEDVKLPLLQTSGPGKILSISFSPDENMLAVGDDLENVKVWQLEPRWSLPISIKGSFVAFSPNDGSLLATGGADNTVKLWNVKTGQLLETLSGHTKHILSIAFSPNGKILATGSADSTVMLWDVDTRKLIVTLKGHSNAISSLAFSSKSARLATGSYDGSVKLWDTSNQLWRSSPPLELATLTTSSTVTSLAFSPDDRTLVAGGGDKYLWLWYANSEETVKAQ
jgi:WD40 repeat protein/energy-coupling factor transporter ATP-binding protein EcfA2